MRFLKAILWLMIVLVPFSGLLYSLTYLELEIIGEGSPIANVIITYSLKMKIILYLLMTY